MATFMKMEMIEDLQHFLAIPPYPHIRIVEDENVVTYEEECRSWKERLFSWPWRPLLRTKMVKKPAMYIVSSSSSSAWVLGRNELLEYIVAHPTIVNLLINGKE